MVSIYHLSFSPDLPLWLKNGKISPFPLGLLATPSTHPPSHPLVATPFTSIRRVELSIQSPPPSSLECFLPFLCCGWMNEWLTAWLVLRLPFLYSAVAPVIQFRIKITFISHYTQMTGAAGPPMGGFTGHYRRMRKWGEAASQSDWLVGWLSEWRKRIWMVYFTRHEFSFLINMKCGRGLFNHTRECVIQ